MMAVWKIAPALAAGNTVVLKPSDTTPVSTLLLAELAAPLFPKGALNVVLGKAKTGSLVVSKRRPHWFRLLARYVRVYRWPRRRRQT